MAATTVIQSMGSAVRPPARCSRGRQKSVKERTERTGRNDFLNHSFKSVWVFEGRPKKAEREFFNSLSNLCAHYEMSLPETVGLPFPQNIYHSWAKVENMLNEKDKQLACFIVSNDRHEVVLATAKTLPLNGLYYIPACGYWKLKHRAGVTAETETLLRLFAYLNQKAGIPFFQQSGCFIDEQYDMLETWLSDMQDEDEQEEPYRQEQRDAMYELRKAGAHLMPEIQNPQLLENLSDLLLSSSYELNSELAGIAVKFAELYAEYPKRTIYDNTNAALLYPDENETIRPDQYTGFYWSPYDCFADQLDEMINCAFQEIAIVEEPVALTVFDRMPAPNRHDPLDYERRLFELMDELRDYLMNLENEKHHGEL